MAKIYEEVIVEILSELDRNHAKYQSLYTKYHKNEDEEARRIHFLLVELCERILKEIAMRERK